MDPYDLGAVDVFGLLDKYDEQQKYVWERVARPKQLPPPGNWRFWVAMGGRGCIAAGTRIFEAARGEYVNVEDLWLEGRPITVLAATPDGIQAVPASCPFIKGRDKLYRVTLESGHSIVVTKRHRVLTKAGWTHVQHVGPGDLLAFDADRLPSSSEHSPSAWLAGDQHWSQRPQGYPGDCSPDPHRCGGQLPLGEAGGQASSPSPGGAREHIYCSGRSGDLAPTSTRSRRHQSGVHPSRRDSGRRGTTLRGAGCQPLSFDPVYILRKLRSAAQLPWLTGHPGEVRGAFRGQSASVEPDAASLCATPGGYSHRQHEGGYLPFDLKSLRQEQSHGQSGPCGTSRQVSHRTVLDSPVARSSFARVSEAAASLFAPTFSSPPQSSLSSTLDDIDQESAEREVSQLSLLNYIAWQRIRSITYCGIGEFFDITVPGPANYLAEGLWNHNSGKTRTGAEFIRKLAEAGKHRRIALIGPTAADVRDTMVEGQSGILSVSRPDFMPVYSPSIRQLEWPNGVIAKTYSAEEADRVRGSNNNAGWMDEIAAWDSPEAFTQFKLSFRVQGADLRCIITSTPKPCAVIRELVKQSNDGTGQVVIIRSSTYENKANLAPEFFTEVIRQYEGTRIGRQELDGELLEDTPGALWNTLILDRTRVKDPPDMARIVISIDPSVTSGEDSDECGLTVCGKGFDGDGYVLDDVSGVMSPHDWATKAIGLYHQWSADCIIAETNNGGDLVGHTILGIDPSVPFHKVTASRGKHLRAEPISALFEQGRCHLTKSFLRLEEQLCSMSQEGYTGRGSPDRLDSMTHALTELMLGSGTVQMFPDLRLKHRDTEPQNALHVSMPVSLKPWWPRYISAVHGFSCAAHWWCQEPSGRLRIYREFVGQELSPEAFGSQISKLSEREAAETKTIPVWLAEKAFDRVNGKSTAALIAEGIEKTLGENKAFLFIHDQAERLIQNPNERYQAIETRLSRMPAGFLNVQALRGGKDQSGWDIVRELLRWQSSDRQRAKAEAPDWEYARELAVQDNAKFLAYLDSFRESASEVLPLLLISTECPALMQAMSGAVRTPNEESALVTSGSSFILQSLRIGALASREEQVMEPKEVFVGRRLDSMPEGASIMSRNIAAIRAEQAWEGTQSVDQINFRRV